MREQGRRAVGDELPGALIWFVGIVGRIEWERRRDPADTVTSDEEPPPGLSYELIVATAADLLAGLERDSGEPPALWAVNRNRPARPAVWRSRVTVKADAATRLFSLSCRTLCWAVLDSGIDATHPAFARRTGDEPLRGDARRAARRRRLAHPRHLRLHEAARAARQGGHDGGRGDEAPVAQRDQPAPAERPRGRLGACCCRTSRCPRTPTRPPPTSTAPTSRACWRATGARTIRRGPPTTTCRASARTSSSTTCASSTPDGAGDEFAILAALQYVRWLNSNASAPVIHGVNLSLSLDHEVGAYACGRTPVCDECERLLGSGTVVVAAAGNEGRAYYSMASGTAEGYRQISITDPGNADGVITVGATHRHQPHTYGVSYFSSRGPTGDGRFKPDLVAPGEKITAPVPNLGLKSLDGTSMAAPHVSGAAALLMARHPELIGSPREVKRVLCATATDLGRERYFQGSGVVDALRAIQAV